jgi:heme/copper-type cytochrome/quinol oxidase subunit 1
MQTSTSKRFQIPYNLFLLASMIVWLMSAAKTSSIIDIHFYDTYIILPGRMGMWIATFILLFLWTLYLLTKQILYSKMLIWIHVMGTITCVLAIIWLMDLLAVSGLAGTPRRYYAVNDDPAYKLFNSPTEAMNCLLGLLLLMQLLFLLNLALGLYRKRRIE